MHAFATDGSRPNNDAFSPASRGMMGPVIINTGQGAGEGGREGGGGGGGERMRGEGRGGGGRREENEGGMVKWARVMEWVREIHVQGH